ncbi:hypothetical protein JKP88DRAFT_157126 [Tribonema minus]|uniref:Kelch repeat protein n=1 Tax=Tribonema minus TaxID=303371 RepID=A0A836CI07_9STRA|nr:hypothetical protein JKP88DRAFT_157126 [Tribonema minus]
MSPGESWTRIQATGEGPLSRSGHGAVVIGDMVYLFGGYRDVATQNDLYRLNMRTLEWTHILSKGAWPSPRATFAICAGPEPTQFTIVGGAEGDGGTAGTVSCDVWVYDTTIHEWKRLTKACPNKVYGASACWYDGRLLVYGGSSGSHYYDGVVQYNPRKDTWHTLITYGDPPSARYKHACGVMGDSMYIIGGGAFKPPQDSIDMYKFNFRNFEWSAVEAEGKVPPGRTAHCCWFDATSGIIYTFGGFDKRMTRQSDLSEYDTLTHNRRSIHANNVPPARAFHAAVLYDGALYVLGGADGDVRYGDVWRFAFTTTPPTCQVLAARALAIQLPTEMIDLISALHARHITSILKND